MVQGVTPSRTTPTAIAALATKTTVGLGNVVNLDTSTTANITDSANKRFVTDTQSSVLALTSGTNTGDGSTPPETVSTIGTLISGATLKNPPVDADSIGLSDSAASNVLKKLTWANVKAALKTYFDTLYPGGSGTSTGSNTGDQTSIVGISGTKAQFDTAVSDGNILYVGDITQYTDEAAQDAVGLMVDGSLTYVDATPLLQRAALTGHITAPAGSNATSLGSFTKAQLSTAVSDGDPLYAGDISGISDGDKGDITVSGSGATWTIDAGVITPAKTSITGVTTGAKYLRDDWSWQTVTASTPDTLLTKNIIGADTTVTAGYSAYIPDFIEISDTFTFEVGLDSCLEIG
jgi:hypothetical protein